MREHSPINLGQEVAWEAANWSRMQELFHLAEIAPPGERTRILTEASNDTALVARVLALLSTADHDVGGIGPFGDALTLGTRVGPYALLRHLGTGGLGSVYLAERVVGGAALRCAVKVLSMHAAGPAFEARFHREQQILSALNHPNITRMMDAGLSETAQPYLAMEFVDGVDIDTYCEEKRLSVPARLALFQQICEAVAYAHRALTVHLDLKPSNVMITKDGTVKLLDFGTAKLVDTNGARTTTVLATPAYASPEQLRNEPVTTACDIYALGVILFELLAGRRPYQDSSVPMLVDHALREHEPPRMSFLVAEDAASLRDTVPSRLRAELRGDLDAIVARCLRSRPQDRYASVDALFEDVRSYLEQRPVRARKQSLRYRLGRFVRRNRVPVVSTAAVLLLLLAVGLFALERQREAIREGQRAERMQNFLYNLLRLANTNYTNKPTTTISEFLQLGIQTLPEFIHDPTDRRAAQLSLAESLFDNTEYAAALPVFQAVAQSAAKAGDVGQQAEAEAFGGMSAQEIGNVELSNHLVEHAESLKDRKGVSVAQRVWIVSFYVCSRFNQGVRPEADLTLLENTVNEAVRKGGVPDRELGWALGNLGTTQSIAGKLDQAQREEEMGLAILKRQPYTLCDQADAISTLGDLSAYHKDNAKALEQHRAAYAAEAECKGADDLNALHLRGLVARDLIQLQRAGEALSLLEDSMPAWRRNAPDSIQFVSILLYLAQAHIAEQQFAPAADAAQEALRREQTKVSPTSTTTAVTYVVLAQALDGDGRTGDALGAAKKAERIYASMAKLTPLSASYRASNLTELEKLRTKLRPH